MFADFCLLSARRTVAARRNTSASLLCLTAFLLAASSIGTADTIPLPRERPAIDPEERSPKTEIDAAPSPYQSRLAELGVFEPSPVITGPGECTATDVVKVDAVLLPDKQRVGFAPPVTLRCPMAEAVTQWITNDIAPTIAALGTSLRSIESLDSFDCRPRNGMAGTQVSEHGHANALDVRSFKLANGVVVELNNASCWDSVWVVISAQLPSCERMLLRACAARALSSFCRSKKILKPSCSSRMTFFRFGNLSNWSRTL
jgi:Extensin-like protein C-terminus